MNSFLACIYAQRLVLTHKIKRPVLEVCGLTSK